MASKRISGLDFVRSIAILLVLFLHARDSISTMPMFLKNLFSRGWAGVDIFFVLSGFLIASQIIKEEQTKSIKKKLKHFWVKRWFRTIPLYLAALFVYVVVKPLAGWEFNGDVWKYFFFIQNYTSPKDFVQSWSLCIEEQFYLIFPLLVFGFSSLIKKPWFWLLPILVSLICRQYIISGGNILNETQLSYSIAFPSYTRMDGISLGVFLAFTQDYWRPFVKKSCNLIFLSSLLGFSLSLIYFGHTPLGVKAVFVYTVLSLFSAGMVMAGNYIKLPSASQSSFFWIATLSYGAYLWNNVFMRIFVNFGQNMHWALSTILFFTLTFVVSYLTFRIIETPFINMRSKFLD